MAVLVFQYVDGLLDTIKFPFSFCLLDLVGIGDGIILDLNASDCTRPETVL